MKHFSPPVKVASPSKSYGLLRRSGYQHAVHKIILRVFISLANAATNSKNSLNLPDVSCGVVAGNHNKDKTHS